MQQKLRVGLFGYGKAGSAAAKLLRRIAPFADVEILEQHFKKKPEASGTARKIPKRWKGTVSAASLRLDGIAGHHGVIFGFLRQTVRLTQLLDDGS